MIEEYIAPDWSGFLSKNKLSTFEDIWSRKDEWFEEPNYGRSKNGWSGVCKIDIDGRSIFVKKQSNFYSYSLKKPLGITVAKKEFEAIQLFNKKGVACLTPVYFGCRKENGELQAIVATEALDGFSAFSDVAEFLEKESLYFDIKRHLLRSIGTFLRDSHSKDLMHMSLYPKHIFVSDAYFQNNIPSKQPYCRFIDMEKAKKAKWQSKKQLRDLETLNRRSKYWSKSQRLTVLLSYLDKSKVDTEVRTFLSKLLKTSKK